MGLASAAATATAAAAAADLRLCCLLPLPVHTSMDTLCNCRDGSGLDRAVELLETMRDEGLTPDAITYRCA